MPSTRPQPRTTAAGFIHFSRLGLLAMGLAACALAQAQTTVSNAWVRATVPQQKATGMFATLQSASGGRLVSVATSVAGVVEIHEMSMDGNVMRMRALPDGLALPAGQPVALKPGSFHVMLMDLKQPLKAGDTVALTLVVQDAKGQKETLAVQAPVMAMGTAAMGTGAMGAGATGSQAPGAADHSGHGGHSGHTSGGTHKP